MKNTPFSTYTLSYADWRDYKIHMVNSPIGIANHCGCAGRLFQAMQEHMEKNPPQNFWAKHNKEELVKRTMQISDRLADVIGLDKSYPKCKKHLEKQQEAQNDVGGEALTLVTTRGAR